MVSLRRPVRGGVNFLRRKFTRGKERVNLSAALKSDSRRGSA